MIDLSEQKEYFKNHEAKFIDYGNIKILDFKNPSSSHYRIRFMFEEDYCKLHISGNLGELIATNYNNMTFEKFSDFVNDVESESDLKCKVIECCSRDAYKSIQNQCTLFILDNYIEKLERKLKELL